MKKAILRTDVRARPTHRAFCMRKGPRELHCGLIFRDGLHMAKRSKKSMMRRNDRLS